MILFLLIWLMVADQGTVSAFSQTGRMRGASSSERSTAPHSYSSRLWPTSDEPLRNVIQAVTQTTDGMLWIGTAGGLARFDGQDFEFVSIASSNHLAKQKVNVLEAGGDGTLWVGTAGEGLFRLQKDRWSAFPMQKLEPNILALHNLPDDSLWIGTRKGMGLIRDDTLSLRSDKEDVVPGPEKHFSTETVRSIERDADGNLWIGAGTHLMHLQEGAVLAAFNLFDYDPTYLRSISCRRDGSIWIGSNGGLLRYQGGEFTHFAKFNGLPDNIVTAVFEDSRGNLWIGTSAGLCRFADGRFVVETTSDGEAYDQILCLFEDRENNLWVGAKNGLYQLRVQQFTTYTTRHGLAHNNVISVYEEDDGTMWIGTWGGGLHRLRDEQITLYSSAKTATMRNDLVLAIHGAKEGGIWFSGDYDSGIYRVKGGEMKRFTWNEGIETIAARALLEESSGRLLVGTALRSIITLDNGTFAEYAGADVLPSRNIRSLLKRRDGTLWIGTEGGLICQSNEQFQTFTVRDGLPDDFIQCLFEDSEQSLWVGTLNGMSRLRGGKFVSYTQQHGLPEKGVLEILEDDAANFWLASRQGVYRIKRSEFDRVDSQSISKVSPTIFGRPDGMVSAVCVGVAKPSAFKSKDGRLWFATTKGIAVTDPQLRIERNEVPPSVLIQEVVANKVVHRLRSKGSTSKFQHRPLVFPPANGELEFRYTALSYVAPEKNRFKYKLAGFDTDWVEAGTRRAAFYNSVPPGSYEFFVIACNNDGVWSPHGSSVRLTLQPHYWQTNWFFGLIAFASFGFVGGLVRYSTWKRMQSKFQLLEQQHAIEKERTRIAEDMHDELGARLTEIRVLSDLTEKSKDRPGEVALQSRRISNAAGELIRNLHSIVWAVNPANDSLEKLADYICGYAQEFLKGAAIRCRLERADELPDLKLPSEIRHNIVMVIKEALNNTIKHAGASEVRISIAVSESRVTFSVADNGKGFPVGNASAFGNGLHNMEKRMLSIGGRYELLTEPGKGTTIRFEIPL